MTQTQATPSISFVIRILLWLSKTDTDLYIKSPKNVQFTRKSLGIMVLFTGIFGFLAASYIFRTLIHQYDAATHTMTVSRIGLIFSYFIGLFFAAGGVFIDREIVSAGSRMSALIWLPLAITIGLIISIPLKVLMFSEQINKELTLSAQEENIEHIEQYNNRIFSIESRMNNLCESIDKNRDIKVQWHDIMNTEATGRIRKGSTGIAGEGLAYRNAKQNFELYQSLEQQYIDELYKHSEEYNAVVEQAEFELERMRKNQSYDFVSQYRKMQEMMRENNDLKFLGNMIILLFVTIACFPSIVKLLKEPDEYDRAFSNIKKPKTQEIKIVDDG